MKDHISNTKLEKGNHARAELLLCSSKPIALLPFSLTLKTSSQSLEHQHGRRNVTCKPTPYLQPQYENKRGSAKIAKNTINTTNNN